uniref:Uncharacterized protein n=1 Tax=Cannabis sativa TaxID=3483 RepID=A0A803PU10_CANSA
MLGCCYGRKIGVGYRLELGDGNNSSGIGSGDARVGGDGAMAQPENVFDVVTVVGKIHVAQGNEDEECTYEGHEALNAGKQLSLNTKFLAI